MAGRHSRRDTGFTSYYGRPVLKKPTWAARDIAGYLFLGGLAGASSVLAAGADLTGRTALAKGCKAGALAAISGSLFALVHDLGRPGRFLNMLRVVKPSSPMSVGSWILVAYGPQAGLAAVTALSGRFTRLGRVATVGAGLVGPAVAAYTAVLVADTAVPAWHEGHRELPFVFVGSAASAAGGLGMVVAPVEQAGPARRAALAGGVFELVATEVMERRMGPAAETLRTGRGGRLMKAASALTAAGGLLGATLGRRSRAAAVLGGLAALAGSACTRFGVFHAGVASAEDPKYVVGPQRERRAREGR
ncbi:NrfD/PsrC family molybdoenzyme membrane anchor subunit [Saccharothrix algeriensis]|uniref:Formate-dependent nitrite reductase membrane component NrfD n=1 Tax=Saccharothrix algeriensis TaxID=173560 RepID=A0A8T8HXZ1_9PSEU|nr:NrfD/PsrC family molybdoenzyme membrane anchor subunit [Saccharothrix algeriensis]MBM7814262.1 formate-dependent nitrite reductase membrane component NrfD [Saccharothrix algeriensis]QTR02614.1 polysulfide reductase NrfD [Saccharothrix algeriensis]